MDDGVMIRNLFESCTIVSCLFFYSSAKIPIYFQTPLVKIANFCKKQGHRNYFALFLGLTTGRGDLRAPSAFFCARILPLSQVCHEAIRTREYLLLAPLAPLCRLRPVLEGGCYCRPTKWEGGRMNGKGRERRHPVKMAVTFFHGRASINVRHFEDFALLIFVLFCSIQFRIFPLCSILSLRWRFG